MSEIIKLIVIGLSVLNIGTIKEEDGIVDQNFWLRNDGAEPVVLLQGYTSCGCTTIDFAKDAWLQPGDSTQVSLHFNPRGKGGEFYESGTIAYSTAIDGQRQRVQMALEGECITSEETLLQQYPILITEGLRLSTNRFDVGYMSVGETKKRYVSLLHQQEGNRRELITLDFSVDDTMPKGLQHITKEITTLHNGKQVSIPITLDVYIK